MRKETLAISLLLGALVHSPAALAQTPPDSAARVHEGAVVDTLPAVEVTDSFDRSVRRVRASSQGALTLTDLRERPTNRPGAILEAIPGVVISQHSGEGKANQYYLRGFNLDHGTDMATFVAGIPVNMPTHAHGQGYSDLNFLIPELVSGVEYKKGPYFAEEGDFGTAGAAHIGYANHLDQSIAQLSYDQDGYRRALIAGSVPAARGDLLYALEGFHNDGPWVHPDDYQKVNGLLRWGRTGASNDYRITAMGYDGRWNSTDQVPERAVDDGSISRFGAIDPSDGGRSHRYSLSVEWQHFTPRSLTQTTAYAIDYGLNLFSNFTYFLDDTTHGDQFEQADARIVSGLRTSHSWSMEWAGRAAENVAGLQFRRDDISRVGLYDTQARVRLSTTSEDRVAQTSVSPFVQNTLQWSPWLRSTLGLRADAYWFHVASDNPLNSGDASSTLLSPKLGLSLGPWAKTAWFLNAGRGFHSNDARGSTITVDPKTGDPVERVKPLVPATGAEVGVMSHAVHGLETSLSLWLLDLESELVFAGDAGSTEASRPSRRTGFEWSAAYAMPHGVRADIDAAWSHARFTEHAPEGDHVPGAVEGVVSAGISADDVDGFLASVRVRYFGPRPLIEDNSVRSQASTTLSAEVGHPLGRWGTLVIEGFNLLDAKVGDIDYFYTSRLPGEPAAGVDDIHTHPEAQRTFRFRLTAAWPGAVGSSDTPPQTGHPKNGQTR